MAKSSHLDSVTTEEALKRLHDDEDFVHLKRYGFSLAKTMERFPDGAPDRIIGQALMITTADVERIYEDIVQRLRMKLADPTLNSNA